MGDATLIGFKFITKGVRECMNSGGIDSLMESTLEPGSAACNAEFHSRYPRFDADAYSSPHKLNQPYPVWVFGTTRWADEKGLTDVEVLLRNKGW